MSPDVIKAREFAALFAPSAESEGAAMRYSSSERRVSELERLLVEAKEERDRAVAEAEARGREAEGAVMREEWRHSVSAAREATQRLVRVVEGEREVALQEVVALAVAIASKILRREIAGDDEFTVRLVRRCLRKIVRGAEVLVRVHPGERDRVVEALGASPEDNVPGHKLTVISDRRVESGGCVVETPDFVVDGTLRTQLEAAGQALQGEVA